MGCFFNHSPNLHTRKEEKMFKNFRCSGFFRAIIAVSMISALAACGGSNDGVGAASVAKVQNTPLMPLDSTGGPNTAKIFAEPLFTLDGYLTDTHTQPPPMHSYYQYIVRDNWTLSGNTLSVTQEYLPTAASTTWTPVTPVGKFDTALGKYLMKADGTWTGMLPASQLHPAYQLSSVGSTLVGTDPNTNIGVTFSYKYVDLSGQLLSTIVSFTGMTGTFLDGSTGYVQTLTYSSDQFSIPSYSAASTTPYTDNGITVFNVLGDSSTTYTSVQQVMGLDIPLGGYLLTLSADGTGQLRQQIGSNPPTVLNSPVSWAPYSNNSDVLVITLVYNDLKNLPIDGNLLSVIKTGNLAVALRDGRLQLALKTPNVITLTAPQLKTVGLNQVVPAYAAALAAHGFY